MLYSMLLVSNLAPGGPTSYSLAPTCPITPVWKYRVILKTLNSWFRFVLNRIGAKLWRTMSLPGARLDTACQVKLPKNTDNIKGSHFHTKQRVCRAQWHTSQLQSMQKKCLLHCQLADHVAVFVVELWCFSKKWSHIWRLSHDNADHYNMLSMSRSANTEV